MKILLVDDEPQYVMLLQDFLESQKWSVVTAENGEDALEELKRAKFDIIVSDVYMPIMDGLRFHRALRAIPDYEKLPFLFVSAFEDVFMNSSLSLKRNDGFLRKGQSTADLAAWIVYLTTPEPRRGLPPSSSSIDSAERPKAPGQTRDNRNLRTRGDR